MLPNHNNYKDYNDPKRHVNVVNDNDRMNYIDFNDPKIHVNIVNDNDS